MQMALSMSSSALSMARKAIKEAHPEASEDDLAVLFVDIVYGHDLAEGYRKALQRRRQEGRAVVNSGNYSSEEIDSSVKPFVEALERIGVHYYIGGSVATYAWGVPRTTADADIVVDLRHEHVLPLVAAIRELYYEDEAMIRDAIDREATFNVIFFANSFKLDIFVAKHEEFDELEAQRVRKRSLGSGEGAKLYNVSSPEDIALRKLSWYRSGGEVSERQLNDVTQLFKIWARQLDRVYLRTWGAKLGVRDLIDKALEDAGLPILD